MLKKLGIGISVIFGLFVLAAIIVPLFFDANKFRPQIEKIVRDNLNADFELGNLKLSLWGGLHIGVEKMVLSEKGSGGKRPLVSMNDAQLVIPISSLFSGKPDITLSVQRPSIQIVSSADGKTNVSKISKADSSAPAAPPAPQGKSSSGGSLALPFELSFHIEDGYFEFSDQKKGTKTEIKSFDFDLKKFTLDTPFGFSFKSDLDIKELKDLTLRGHMVIEGKAGIYMKAGGGLDHVNLETQADLSGILIRYAKMFDKAEKVPLKLAVKLDVSEKNLKIEKGHFVVADASVDTTGSVNNFDAPIINLNIASSKFVFDHWQKIVAPLQDFDMKGTVSFNIKISGPTGNLAFAGNATANDISLKAPGIVPRISDFNSNLSFSNDTVTLAGASLKMGVSDLSVDGSVKNFSRPIINFKVKSALLDVDSLLPQKSSDQEKVEAQAEPQKPSAAGQQAANVDIEKAAAGPIATMKKNPIAKGVDFTGTLQVAKLRVHKAEITNLNTELTFKDLVVSLKKATATAFGGSMAMTSSIDFRDSDPGYSIGGEVSGLDVNAAMTNQMPMMKDTLFGKGFAKFSMNGSGLSKAKVKQALKGSGNFRLENGTWSALKVMQQIGEKLNSIPGAKDKLGSVIITGKFRHLKSDFNIASGNFNIVNMIAEMEEANSGMTGNGHVDFDTNLNLAGKIMVPGGGDVPGELRGPDGRLTLPYEIACMANSPCLKMEGATQVIAKAYLKKEGGQAVKKVLEKIDNPQVQDLLKKLSF